MCLAVPGRIVSVQQADDDPVTGRVGTVDFQGSQLDVGLTLVPEAGEGDWVLVHAGYAISTLDEAEARETWEYLAMAGAGEVPPELRAPPGDPPEGTTQSAN